MSLIRAPLTVAVIATVYRSPPAYLKGWSGMSKSVSGFAVQSRLRSLRKLICAIPLLFIESITFHDFGLSQLGQARL
jgi:hypothetical protein